MKVNETSFKKGHTPWNKKYKRITKNCLACGKPFETNEGKIKLGAGKFCSKSCANRGKYSRMWGKTRDLHHSWKGDDVKYSGVHEWIRRNWSEKEGICEHCGKSGLKKHNLHWANKDHKYRRNRSDWMVLCAKCHRDHDIKYNNWGNKDVSL